MHDQHDACVQQCIGGNCVFVAAAKQESCNIESATQAVSYFDKLQNLTIIQIIIC